MNKSRSNPDLINRKVKRENKEQYQQEIDEVKEKEIKKPSIFYRWYTYSTVSVSILTILSWISHWNESYKMNFLGESFKTRLMMSFGQLPVHLFFLVRAKTDNKLADKLPPWLFYKLLIVCNISIAYMLLNAV